MTAVVAIDAGTTGVRAIAFGEDGRPLASSYGELTQHYPRPGWVEHDPTEIWDLVRRTVSTVVSDVVGPVAAIGITNQRETVVAWDRKDGLPLHMEIVWQDRRTASRTDELRESGHLELVRSSSGLVLDPYFSATKFEWLLSEGGVELGPDLAFGTVDSWILWNLTGGAEGGLHVTDATNASRTLLYDIGKRQWSAQLCDLFGVPVSALPEVRPSSARVGITSASGGTLAGIPISGMAGDQQAALFGQACFEPGMTKATYGTGSFVLVNAGAECPEPADGLLTSIAWELGDGAVSYALEGSIFITGACLQWLRDEVGAIDEVSEAESIAASIPSTEGLYLVPAFAGLGSPWWDPEAMGALVGASRGIGRAHLVRAAVEAMAYQTRDVLEAMERARRPPSELRADGGASVMDLLLQLVADGAQVPVARPAVRETTAIGAAYLAGLAEGVWGSLEEVAGLWALDHRFEPRRPRVAADAGYQGWLRALGKSRGWASA